MAAQKGWSHKGTVTRIELASTRHQSGTVGRHPAPPILNLYTAENPKRAGRCGTIVLSTATFSYHYILDRPLYTVLKKKRLSVHMKTYGPDEGQPDVHAYITCMHVGEVKPARSWPCMMSCCKTCSTAVFNLES